MEKSFDLGWQGLPGGRSSFMNHRALLHFYSSCFLETEVRASLTWTKLLVRLLQPRKLYCCLRIVQTTPGCWRRAPSYGGSDRQRSFQVRSLSPLLLGCPTVFLMFTSLRIGQGYDTGTLYTCSSFSFSSP